ncbi:DUF3139 domain-containing protein [Paenibacillus oralis]|uniref:DUF3139 domain-containing protein n=1 Tax=Paenibacillus oralis TaxID=2490856 RepID=A0A3P3UBH8_9BACL|nr:DUF3139 domain-containing protein [Paenibacillus oralis]RRJ66968.1 DUF3139 domain-containing protein [Paenibacillus oralis]
MTRKKKVLIIIAAIVILAVSIFFIRDNLKLRALEGSLEDYLINEKGYAKSDIISIKARHSKMPEYPVYVRFKNEPDVVYLFTDLGKSEWKQLDKLKGK